MLEQSKLEQLAHLSVARGCGFAALGIATMMVGLAGHMPTAFKAGGILLLIVCLVLILKAARAGRRRYRDTELWVMLEPNERPSEAVAQRVIASALRHMYLCFARRFALGAALLLTGSLILGVLGPPQERHPAAAKGLEQTSRPPGLSPSETSAFRRMP